MAECFAIIPLIEEDQLNDILGVGRPQRVRTLLTDEARLTIYDGYARIELFDLHNDPLEMKNLQTRISLCAQP